MIVWIFFESGSGGDGFANLLEQSSNVVPLDGNKQWRIHRYVDSKAKFWAPNLQNNGHRTNTVEQLSKEQVDIANSDTQYLIITSHDVELKKTFQQSTISEDKHIKVLLQSKNRNKQLDNARLKNLKNLIEFDQSLNNQTLNSLPIVRSNFDLHLDAIPDNWNDIKNLIENFGLNLSEEEFSHYKQIVSGEFIYTIPGIEYYESYVDADNITKYTMIRNNRHN